MSTENLNQQEALQRLNRIQSKLNGIKKGSADELFSVLKEEAIDFDQLKDMNTVFQNNDPRGKEILDGIVNNLPPEVKEKGINQNTFKQMFGNLDYVADDLQKIREKQKNEGKEIVGEFTLQGLLDQVLEVSKIGDNDEKRIGKAQELLSEYKFYDEKDKKKYVESKDRSKVIQAHKENGCLEKGAFQLDREKDKEVIKKKHQILEEGGFSSDERKVLLHHGVCMDFVSMIMALGTVIIVGILAYVIFKMWDVLKPIFGAIWDAIKFIAKIVGEILKFALYKVPKAVLVDFPSFIVKSIKNASAIKNLKKNPELLEKIKLIQSNHNQELAKLMNEYRGNEKQIGRLMENPDLLKKAQGISYNEIEKMKGKIAYRKARKEMKDKVTTEKEKNKQQNRINRLKEKEQDKITRIKKRIKPTKNSESEQGSSGKKHWVGKFRDRFTEEPQPPKKEKVLIRGRK